jgi:hypothetical protein
MESLITMKAQNKMMKKMYFEENHQQSEASSFLSFDAITHLFVKIISCFISISFGVFVIEIYIFFIKIHLHTKFQLHFAN